MRCIIWLSVAMIVAAEASSIQSITRLRSAVKGNVLGPDSDGYDRARRVYNGTFDLRPALIVQCARKEDVQAAVRFASENGWFPAIRGGGHSAAGFGVCEGGLVI